MSCQSSLRFVVALFGLFIPATLLGAVYTFPDPAGDTFGVGAVQIDITSITATLTPDPTPTNLGFMLSFAGPISAPSLFAGNSVIGFLDIDTDQHAGTGAVSHLDTLGQPRSGLGIEFFVDLQSEAFNPGNVDLVNAATLATVTSVPISFGASSLSFSLPLSFLGGDQGAVNFGALVGTFSEATDQAVGNTGVIPEPGSLLVWGLLVAVCAVSAGCAARVQRWRSSS